MPDIAHDEPSATSCLAAPAISIEPMTPDECRNGGENLSINYSFATTPFGDILIASTAIGICSLEFSDNATEAFDSLRQRFPHARLSLTLDSSHQNVLTAFSNDPTQTISIKLHLKGSAFQIKVWNALLKIPFGGLLTYGDIASAIAKPQACRAVGSAISKNPIAFFIPCHRIIRSSGEIGNYRWGETRKTNIISWEATNTEIRLQSGQSYNSAT